MDIQTSIQDTMAYMKETLRLDANFDIIYRTFTIKGRMAVIFCVDGFTQDDMLERLLQYMMEGVGDPFPEDAHAFSKTMLPYAEIGLMDNYESVLVSLLSGISILFVDGYEKALSIDCRTYPARNVQEPDKDKVMRGSRDGFVETLVYNTALIRRRIRDPKLTMEMHRAGRRSATDIVVCYIEDRVDRELLQEVCRRIDRLEVDALTMNQQSLAECLFPYKWYNPFPKFKYTERPDAAAATILEGKIVILVDNSPSAMLLPSSIFDIVEEADECYFPPVTGTYLRLSRMLIAIATLQLTPIWLLLVQNPQWLPHWMEFTRIQEPVNIPIVVQLLLLELAIDGLRLAAVNTPNMLSTPFSVLAALVLGEFSVRSGWFNSETMLYMAFVAVANYTQASFELGYALKFMRMIILFLTALGNVWGFLLGEGITVVALLTNQTISGGSYLDPLIPFRWDRLKRRFFRTRLPHGEKNVRS